MLIWGLICAVEVLGEGCGAEVIGINRSGDDRNEALDDNMGESVAEAGEPEMDVVGTDIEGGVEV